MAIKQGIFGWLISTFGQFYAKVIYNHGHNI